MRFHHSGDKYNRDDKLLYKIVILSIFWCMQ